MSILARLHDAQLLYEHGRLDGALLTLLVAVAATSRRRYPSKDLKDGGVFCKFVREEMGTLIGSICNNSIPGFQITFKGKHLSFEKILYKYLRCELAHQAKSVKEIVFIEHPSCLIWLNGHELILNQAFLQGFANICHSAPENADFANQTLDRPAAQLLGEPCGILVNILPKPFNFRQCVKWN